MLSIIVIHNFAVLGLFALENITMAEMFGSRNRFTVWLSQRGGRSGGGWLWSRWRGSSAI
jgi:hypothetical protein